MNKIIDAIAQLYKWLGEYLATVLPEDLFKALNDLPDPDFESFKTAE